MIKGIGTDILKISRLQSVLEDQKGLEAFLNHTYTEKELEAIRAAQRPLFRFATHFAGKEAVFKSLGLPSDTRFQWKDMEILYLDTGQPYVVLHGKIKELCKEKGIGKVLISLSYDTEYAVAYAVSEEREWQKSMTKRHRKYLK